MNEVSREELEDFVRYVATDWIELSCDKVTIQRNNFVKRAKNILERINQFDNTKG
jgi:hypothetical protein